MVTRLLYVGIPVALVGLAIFVAGPDLGTTPEASAPAARLPRYSVSNAQWIRLGARGEPEFRAEAASIDWYPDDSAELTQLRIDSLGGTASPWRLEAPAGHAPAGERRIRLTGSVHAVSERPDAETVDFTAPDLWVDLLRHELSTQSAVVLRAGVRSATARGLQADFAGEHLRLLEDVQVDYVPES